MLRRQKGPLKTSKPAVPAVRDVIVLGAGQSGLSAGYYLQQAGLDFIILDRSRRIGDAWRFRYESLTLFTPRAFNGLPGLAMPGDPDGRPDRLEFADFLEDYATHFALPVQLGVRVDKIQRDAEGHFELTLSNQSTMRARSVILAYGTYPAASVPAMRKDFAPKVTQLNMMSYSRPAQVTEGPVLVVGDGASGRDIAAELAPGHQVFLATGRKPFILPARWFGKSLWYWLNEWGFFKPKTHSRKFGLKQPLPSTVKSLRELKARGVVIKPRLMSANGTAVTFQDGTTQTVKTVIWAVGYVMDTRWIDVPEAKDEKGYLLHERGVSKASGLYLAGRRWQSGMASGLIVGAGPDAEYVVNDLIEDRTECTSHAD
ncbi:NAD(P)/FAD-dependent oxidoreductase [Asticcacaulis sp. AND118]|uniref:flavin-containing monooxygenase n=1 Tax=Asticcacaulis sp. AND118 TaxID=2840468 RepID=UPI001CFF5F5B|nr:NAD(P)/FAD-dependent oxidoreductase [Asticcacaulis sp. AND118]UDF04036.1 NAD(P)/FAD-dependent oxidoreductase [Asticcacaulis sp. AND118]